MVNLPNVEKLCDAVEMALAPSTGTKLIELRKRSGMSLRKIAMAAGYAGASSIQRYFSTDYDSEYLPPVVAEKLVKALVGKGRPAIAAEEITELAAYMPAHVPGSSLEEPVAAAIVWHILDSFGVEVERTDPEVLSYARFLQGLLKLLASQQASNGVDLVEGVFAGLALRSRS